MFTFDLRSLHNETPNTLKMVLENIQEIIEIFLNEFDS